MNAIVHHPEASVGYVVGMTDACWQIEAVSATTAGGGVSAPDLGTSLLVYVHTGDRAALLDARERAIAAHVSTAIEVQVGRPGCWSLVRLVLTPMAGPTDRLGFVLSPRDADKRSAEAARLQKHLDRIGRELEAAGIDVHRGEGVNLDVLPPAVDLSPRQWEVLHRLLRGERVPGIARDLFISTSTVRNHLSTIFAVVGVHSQEELLTRFRRQSPMPTRVAS